MTGETFARLSHEWNGLPFSVHVSSSTPMGLAEFGRWENVPRPLAEMALGAFVSEISACEVFWAVGRHGPLCRTRFETRSEGASRFILLSGDPVFTLPYNLTMRELDVLTLVVPGLSNVEIGSRLNVSPRTVSTHLDSVMRKINRAGRTSAAALALDEGLLRLPIPGGPEGFEDLRIGRILAATKNTTTKPPRNDSPVVLRRRPLRLGAALPIEGSARDDGLEMLHGVQLAIEEINAAGGVRGRMIEAEVINVDVDRAGSVREAFHQLLERDVDVVTSGYLAEQSLAHEIIADAGIPYLHAATSSAMERIVADDPGRYNRIFQVCPSDHHYAPKFVEFIDSVAAMRSWAPGQRRLVVLEQSSWQLIDFGTERAAKLADSLGWELDIVKVEASLDGEASAWAAAARRVLHDPPAAIMIGSYFVADHIDVMRVVHEVGPDSLVYSVYAPSVPEFRALLGPMADGVLWATTTGTYSDEFGARFARRYRQRFGQMPGRSHAGIAYDRTFVVSQGWSAVDDFRDFGQVAAAIRRLTFRGVNGSYYFDNPAQTAHGFFDRTGDPSLALAHLVYQIQDGFQQIIGPEPYTTAQFQLPPWIRRRRDRTELGTLPY